MNAAQDTIYALATAPGKAGIAVVRVSGPKTQEIVQQICHSHPEPRKALLRKFYDQDGIVIDQGLLLWFPAPHSFTGESVAEFHVHGGRAVIERILSVLLGISHTRPAEAGEFTRRAFENGKLDLTAVEGLADLVAAETESQRRQALRQMEGRLGELYESWRADLLQALAYLEADIDFSDEDLPGGLSKTAQLTLQRLADEITSHLADGNRGEILRRGFKVAILGAPNVGKSSLLNILAKRDAAIVTPQAGTTRDVIEVHLDLGGYLVTVADTAGLRVTQDAIEAEGIRRSLQQAELADLKVLIFDATDGPYIPHEPAVRIDAKSLCVLNKIDLLPSPGRGPAPDYLPVSFLTGAGVDPLIQRLTEEVARRLGGSETPGLTRQRHRRELQICLDCLQRALQPGNLPELVAEDVRLAMRALGRITGRADVEDILDIVFSEFCIGK